jgi:hypothetical protein
MENLTLGTNELFFQTCSLNSRKEPGGSYPFGHRGDDYLRLFVLKPYSLFPGGQREPHWRHSVLCRSVLGITTLTFARAGKGLLMMCFSSTGSTVKYHAF